MLKMGQSPNACIHFQREAKTLLPQHISIFCSYLPRLYIFERLIILSLNMWKKKKNQSELLLLKFARILKKDQIDTDVGLAFDQDLSKSSVKI